MKRQTKIVRIRSTWRIAKEVGELDLDYSKLQWIKDTKSSQETDEGSIQFIADQAGEALFWGVSKLKIWERINAILKRRKEVMKFMRVPTLSISEFFILSNILGRDLGLIWFEIQFVHLEDLWNVPKLMGNIVGKYFLLFIMCG